MLKVSVAPSDSIAVVKITGKPEPDDSAIIYAFVEDVLMKEYQSIFVDLSTCSHMDSTFMGMLLMMRRTHEENSGEIFLLNVGEENMKLLTMLGIDNFVPTRELPIEDSPHFAAIDVNKLSRRKHSKMVFMEMAHRALSEANSANARKFGPFLRLLEEERSDRQEEED